MPIGVIVGGVVGGLALLAAGGAGVFFVHQRRRRRNAAADEVIYTKEMQVPVVGMPVLPHYFATAPPVSTTPVVV